MIKKVNVAARTPVVVSSLPAPIRGNVRNITLNEQDIFKCITQKAIVDEVLSNGSLVRLSLSNYNKVNEVVKPEPVVVTPVPVVEEPVVVVEPVVETPVMEEVVAKEAPVEEIVEPVVETPVMEEVEAVEEETEEAPAEEEQVEDRPKHKKKRR